MSRTSVASRLGIVAVAVSTAFAVVALAIVPFLNPVWVGFEQGRTGAAELTGLSEEELRAATSGILEDLILGPPDFDVEIRGVAVLTELERAHMRDVRNVFASFFAAASVAVVVLLAAFWLGGRDRPSWTRRDGWRSVRLGALGLIVGIVIAGIVAVMAFDAAFELFHRIFFPGGNWAFDSRTSRLVQLFPDAFWSETTIAVGAVCLGLAGLVAWFAGRRLAAMDHPAPGGATAGVTAGSLPTTGQEAAK